MRNNERRQATASNLRVYIAAIKQAEAMTQSEWIENQAKCDSGYIPKDAWIAYLKNCALIEADKLAYNVLAA